MFKSLAILAIVVFFASCAHVHEQRFGPSTPGGTYQNSSIPGGISPNNFVQPSYPSGGNQCPAYPNSETDLCLKQVGDSFAYKAPPQTRIGANVNGGSYQFTGPRIIVCYRAEQCAAQRSRCQYADYCMSANECNAAIQSYGGNNPQGNRCPGQVSLFQIPRSNTNVPRR